MPNKKMTAVAEIHYNWGIGDGKSDKEHHRPCRYLPTSFTQSRPLPKNDKPYCDGYAIGYNE